MSRDVSNLDKLVRIIGFSLYLSFIIFFFFLFFRGLKFSFSLFLISTLYFIIIFLILTATKHIHFNVLLRRAQIAKEKSLFNSVYPLSRFRFFNALNWIMILLLAVMAGIYFYYFKPIHGAALLAILALSYFYFTVHKIGIHVVKEGIVFDYGQLIVLLQWKEIKKIRFKGNHVLIDLKEKHIKRRFYIDNPEDFKKVAKKFIKL